MVENRATYALGAAVSALTLALGASGADGQTLQPPSSGKAVATKPGSPTPPLVKPGGATLAPTASKGSTVVDDESPKETRYRVPTPTAAAPTRPGLPPGPGTTKADESPKENRYQVAPAALAAPRK